MIRTAQTLLLTENCPQNLDDYELGYLWWRRPNDEGTAIDSWAENHNVVAEQKCVENGDGPCQRYTLEA